MRDHLSGQTWPVILKSNELTLRPLRLRDRAKWFAVRAENREWLTPWEATLPQVPEHIDGGDLISKRPSFFEMVRIYNRDGRSGRTISLAIWQGPNLIGQITMGGIIYGALRGAHIGYWIDRRFATRGYTTQAVEMVTAYGFDELGLHRIEINLRPENSASRRVAEKAGFILEGDRPRFLHIDGAWRDHICFVKENPAIK
jgi:ribosomal-protein-alanine N-acetyltransferase